MERYLPNRVLRQFGERQAHLVNADLSIVGWTTREETTWGPRVDSREAVVVFKALKTFRLGWEVGLPNLGTMRV